MFLFFSYANGMITCIQSDKAKINEAIELSHNGIVVGGQIVSAIRYADDKAVVASSQDQGRIRASGGQPHHCHKEVRNEN